jgi:hypothetical protein
MRYLYAQGGSLRNSSGHAALIQKCQAWHVTDIIAGSWQSGLLSRAADAGIRVHAWWGVAYWDDDQLEWYPNAPSSWKRGSKLDFELPAVQEAIEDYAAELAAVDGLAGVNLDYFRYSSGTNRRPDGLTAALSGIREQTAGMELTLSAVPIHSGGYDIRGCGQDWINWLSDGLLDYALVMEYKTLPTFLAMLARDFVPLGAALNERIYHIASPTAWTEGDTKLSAGDFAAYMAAAGNVAVFDYSSVLNAGAAYGQALEDLPGDEPEPEPEPEPPPECPDLARLLGIASELDDIKEHIDNLAAELRGIG